MLIFYYNLDIYLNCSYYVCVDLLIDHFKYLNRRYFVVGTKSV